MTKEEIDNLIENQLPYNEHWFYKHHKEIAKKHNDKALWYAKLIHKKSPLFDLEELKRLKSIEIAKSNGIHIVLRNFMKHYCPLRQKIL